MMDMTLNEYKSVTSTCLNGNHQPLTTDMSKHKVTGRNRLGLISSFVPHSSPFYNNWKNIYPNKTKEDMIN